MSELEFFFKVLSQFEILNFVMIFFSIVRIRFFEFCQNFISCCTFGLFEDEKKISKNLTIIPFVSYVSL